MDFMLLGDPGTGLCRSLTCVIVWFFVISSLLTIMLLLSIRYEQQTDTLLQNAQTFSGLPLKNYHRQTTNYLQHIIKIATVQFKLMVDLAERIL